MLPMDAPDCQDVGMAALPRTLTKEIFLRRQRGHWRGSEILDVACNDAGATGTPGGSCHFGVFEIRPTEGLGLLELLSPDRANVFQNRRRNTVVRLPLLQNVQQNVQVERDHD